jgi:hypothetical protein
MIGLVEDAERLGIVAAGELPQRLDQLVRADGLGGVQAAVDPDHGAALGGEGAGLGLVDVLGAGEPLGDFAQAIEFREVGGRRADDHPLGAALLGAAHVDEPHAVGFGGELPEIRLGLHVGREVVVVADGEAEVGLRRRELGGADRAGAAAASAQSRRQERGRRRRRMVKVPVT